MKDESHLPVKEQSLLFRLRKRAEIRRQIPGRLSETEGKPDRIADLLDEAADEIERLTSGYQITTHEKQAEFDAKRNYEYTGEIK